MSTLVIPYPLKVISGMPRANEERGPAVASIPNTASSALDPAAIRMPRGLMSPFQYELPALLLAMSRKPWQGLVSGVPEDQRELQKQSGARLVNPTVVEHRIGQAHPVDPPGKGRQRIHRPTSSSRSDTSVDREAR